MERISVTFTLSKDSIEKLRTVPKGIRSKFLDEAIKRTNIELKVTQVETDV